MLYKYINAFGLRDEIGTCPNIEVEIDNTDKFFIGPYTVKEKDKNILDTEMKRVVTHFIYLNVRIAKNNLAYPLLKETFSVLSSSRCKVLSVLDLKDAFHSLRFSENSKRYCGILLASTSYLYQRMPIAMYGNAGLFALSY